MHSDDRLRLMLTIRSHVVATKNQIGADLAGESVVLHLKNGVYYGLNTVGSRVWTLVQQPIRVQEIVGDLVSQYEVEPQHCEQDVLALIEKLVAEGLVEVRQ